MKFASSYEPGEYESDIYGAWEASGIFAPTIPTVPIDNDGDGVDDRYEASRESTFLNSNTYSIVMPPPNVTGQLHMGHALDHTLMDAMARRKRMQGYDVTQSSILTHKHQ